MDFNGGTTGGMHNQEGELSMVNRVPAPSGTNDRPEARFESFGNTKEHDLKCSELTNQIEALRSDLIRFKTETFKLFENTKELDLKCNKLANQIEVPLANQIDTLKSDLIRFRTETNVQIKPLLVLPEELEACRKELAIALKSDLIGMGEDMKGQLESLDEEMYDVREWVDDIYVDVEKLKEVCRLPQWRSSPCRMRFPTQDNGGQLNSRRR